MQITEQQQKQEIEETIASENTANKWTNSKFQKEKNNFRAKLALQLFPHQNSLPEFADQKNDSNNSTETFAQMADLLDKSGIKDIESPKTEGFSTPHPSSKQNANQQRINLLTQFKLQKKMTQKQNLTVEEMANGIKLINNNFKDYYKTLEVLGQGTSATVFRVERVSDGKVFAVKQIDTKNDDETIFSIKFEFIKMKQVSQENSKIIAVHEMFIDQDKGVIYTIMEFFNGVEMFEVLQQMQGGYSEEKASQLFNQILLGIKFLHDHGICHRDLKPNNILASNDGLTIKITDFNVSKFSDDYKRIPIYKQGAKIKMFTYTGTIAFSAPEIFEENEYTEQIDMWSAGVVLYCMLCGYQPFQGEYIDDLIKDIINAKVDFPAHPWDTISVEAKNLVLQLLTKDPKRRIKIDDALLHPWIIKKGSTNALPQSIQAQLNYNQKSLIKSDVNRMTMSMNGEHQFTKFQSCPQTNMISSTYLTSQAANNTTQQQQVQKDKQDKQDKIKKWMADQQADFIESDEETEGNSPDQINSILQKLPLKKCITECHDML